MWKCTEFEQNADRIYNILQETEFLYVIWFMFHYNATGT